MVAASSITQTVWRTPSAVTSATGSPPVARGDQGIGSRRVGVGEQHRAGLRGKRLDLADTVVLLVGAGEFVLADAVAVVVGDRRGGDDAGLHVPAHGQPVGVVARRRIADQDAVGDQAGEILGGFGVDRGSVRVGVRRQVDLGLGNMQEVAGLAGGALAGFRAGRTS